LKLITSNQVKIIFLLCSIVLYTSLNYIDSRAETKYDVIYKLESKGNTYYIYKDNTNRGWSYVKKDKNFKDTDKKGVVIKTHLSEIHVIVVVSLIICMSSFFSLPLFYGFGWNFKDVRYYCLLKEVSIDREGSKLYYHCRGRILKVVDTEEDTLYSCKGLSIEMTLEEVKKYNFKDAKTIIGINHIIEKDNELHIS